MRNPIKIVTAGAVSVIMTLTGLGVMIEQASATTCHVGYTVAAHVSHSSKGRVEHVKAHTVKTNCPTGQPVTHKAKATPKPHRTVKPRESAAVKQYNDGFIDGMRNASEMTPAQVSKWLASNPQP